MVLGKFDLHPWWKHDNCRDCFFEIAYIIADSGNNAILNGFWCTQGTESWWMINNTRIKIDTKNYSRWKRYDPKGKQL